MCKPTSPAISLLAAHPGGDRGWITRSGRSPEEGNGGLLQYSCLGNPIDRGTWWATVHGAATELDKTQWLNSKNTTTHHIQRFIHDHKRIQITASLKIVKKQQFQIIYSTTRSVYGKSLAIKDLLSKILSCHEIFYSHSKHRITVGTWKRQ